MMTIQIILLAVGAALVCAAIRVQRPEIASAVSLAVSIGVLLLMGRELGGAVEKVRKLFDFAAAQSEGVEVVLRAAGITILGELGVQICMDAGESALAGRIRLACRVVMLGMAMPFIVRIAEGVGTVL